MRHRGTNRWWSSHIVALPSRRLIPFCIAAGAGGAIRGAGRAARRCRKNFRQVSNKHLIESRPPVPSVPQPPPEAPGEAQAELRTVAGRNGLWPTIQCTKASQRVLAACTSLCSCRPRCDGSGLACFPELLQQPDAGLIPHEGPFFHRGSPACLHAQLPPEAPGEALAELRATLDGSGLACFGGLPRDGLLGNVRLDAVAAHLRAQLFAGHEALLDAAADKVNLES